MSKLIKILFFLFLIHSNSYCEDISSLLKSVNSLDSLPSHCGIKVSIYYKDDKKYISKQEIKFNSIKEFKIVTLSPPSQKGYVMGADGENFIFYAPQYRIKSVSPIPDFSKIDEQRPRAAGGGGGAGFILNFDFDKLFKNYNVKFLPGESENYIISITSKRKPEHQRKIWINKKNKLIVKDERYFDKKLYYKFYYEKLEFKNPTEEEIKIKIPTFAISLPSSSGEGITYLSKEEAVKNLKDIPLLKKIPEGFKFVFCKERKEMGQDVIFVRYSDGLINILLQKRGKKALREGLIKMLGGDDILKEFHNYAISNFYERELTEELITVSGEFPTNLLKFFLEGKEK